VTFAFAAWSGHLHCRQEHQAGAGKPHGFRCGRSIGVERQRRHHHGGGPQTARGVWLATSDDLSRLIVETETWEEAIDLSPELAVELVGHKGPDPIISCRCEVHHGDRHLTAGNA
jgi:hypothetical protein